jgi:transposase
VLAAVRQLNRLELVGETMGPALNELATAAPEGLRATVPSEWFPRYAQRFDNLRLPRERSERERLLVTIGADGIQLLAAVYAADTPVRDQLRKLSGVEMLRRICVQQFWTDILDGGSSGFSCEMTTISRLASYGSIHPLTKRPGTAPSGRRPGSATEPV